MSNFQRENSGSVYLCALPRLVVVTVVVVATENKENTTKSYIIIISLVFSRGKDKYWSEIGSLVRI